MNRAEYQTQLQVVQMHETAAWQRRQPDLPAGEAGFLGADKESVKKTIQESVVMARNSLLEEEQTPIKSRLGFDLDLHRVVYKTLYSFRSDTTGAYKEETEGINSQIKFDLETHIGERLNVASSRFHYEIRNGALYPSGGGEPAIAIIKRGRDYRRHHGSKDTAREDAEVVGMEIIQQIAVDPKTLPGTLILSSSPRGRKGSIYQHNFMDKFVVKEDEFGNRILEVERLLTDLNKSEFAERLSYFDSRYDPAVTPMDSYFLSNPVEITLGEKGMNSVDDLVGFVHKDHEYMSYEDYQQVIKVCTPFILDYLQFITSNPDNLQGIVDCYHAIINIADDVAKTIKAQKHGVTLIQPVAEMGAMYARTRDHWAKKEVREASVGCGISSAAASLLGQAFGVIEFGMLTDKYGDREFNCPACGEVNIRPANTLLKNCQVCHSSKVGCEKKENNIVEFKPKETQKDLRKAA